MSIDGVLTVTRRLGLDTPPDIYFIERHPRYVGIVRDFMRHIDAGHVSGVTSVLTLTEVLPVPIQSGNTALAGSYRRFLLESRNLLIDPVTAGIAERAALLRAQDNLRTPDACDAFLTNDARLRQGSELRVLVLEDLVADVSG